MILLVLLACAVRLAAWSLRVAILPDSADLLNAAETVRQDGWGAALHSLHHPLPVLLVSLVPAGADAETWASFGAAVLGALGVWPLHIVARYAAGRHAATIAGLVYAVLPKLVAVASVPLTEPVFLPLLLAAFAAALVARSAPTPRGRMLRCGLAGMFAGLAYLSRPEGLAAGLAIVATAGLTCRKGERLRAAGIVVLAFAVVAGPWVAALSSDRGHFVLSPKKELAEFVGVAAAPKDGSDGVNLAVSVRRLGAALWSALGPVMALVAVGAFAPARWRRRRSATARALLLITAAGFCVLVLRLASGWGYAAARHTLSASVLLLPFAGEGLAVVVGFFPKAVRRRRAALFLAMLLAIPTALIAVLGPDSESGERERMLGEQIAAVERAKGGAGDVVIGSFGQPLVAYYADRALRGDAGSQGRRVRDVRLWRRHQRLLLVSADLEGGRADLTTTLREAHAAWLVLTFWDGPQGSARRPGEELAQRLIEDGVLGTPVVGAGDLAAFPLR